jgi:hypothetical protein
MKSVKMLFLSIFLLLSCKNQEEDISILPGKWWMVGVASSEGKIFAVKPSTEQEEVIIELPDAALVTIKTPFAGTTPSNKFEGVIGRYNNRELKVEDFVITYAGERFWGEQFGKRVRRIIGYQIKSDELYFKLEFDREQLVFKKLK